MKKVYNGNRRECQRQAENSGAAGKIQKGEKVMSIESWKKEFYPVEASKVSKKNALLHSIQKWSGLTKKAVKLHKLTIIGGDLYAKDQYSFSTTSSTCALCLYYYSREQIPYCGSCPLSLVRGSVPCDCYMSDIDNTGRSPFHAFQVNGNTRPMLKWLRRALKFEQATKKQGKLKGGKQHGRGNRTGSRK